MEKTEGTAAADDIRLSTGAIISARFPLISPPATVRAGAARYKDGGHGGEIVDRVVDGGVFENAGLMTARDIAAALKDKHIRTLVLHINNEPRLDQEEVLPPRDGGAFTPRMAVDGAGTFLKRMFGTIGGPLQALYDTRGGHGAEARRLAQGTVDGNCTDRTHGCFYDINVYGALKVTGSDKCAANLNGAKP